jgi:transcription initiation factor TFIIE subunit alpha
MSDGWTPESSSSRKVPYQVQQLARMVAYAFYGKEHGLIVDILCKHSSVKEDDLCEILKLEKKHFRNILQALKGDQIIASKQRITKDASDVSQRSFEYGLEFSSLLNMVKYKLDLMRRKLETEERNNSNRASFSCLDCKKTFSDLEAGLVCAHLTLFSPQTNQ